MNGLAKYFIIPAILLCMPHVAAALPGAHDPLTGGRNYTCNSCHTANATLGTTGYDNICLSCHKPGKADPLSGRRAKAFTAADFANPYRTYTSARPGVVYQTSHKWMGTDTVPKAGALPPLDPYNTVATSFDPAKGMNKKSLKGYITCARCHNVHGDSSFASVDTPFLRSINDKDQMCLDCHRPRNSRSHTIGSHPVNVSYTSAKVKASAFFKKDAGNSSIPPTNPANRTAEMKLKSGLVVCSTCHGVHYADSNSRTFDNYSNSVLGNLSTSKGYLLRTDMRGATAESLNICSNCHNKPNHKKRGQNIQCTDCHGGHVDSLDGSVPNTYVIRRYMNISTSKGAVRNSKAFYQFTGSRRNWNSADPQKPGVCQACHIVPTGGAYPTEHTDTSGANGTLCMSCHVHDSASGAFSANCTTCHGYPPADNHGGGPTGYALDGAVSYQLQAFYKDETNTPHTVHAGGNYTYNCNECHKGGAHNSRPGGSFQDVFKTADPTLASNGQGTTPAYTANNPAGPGTCATYCHSNAKPAIGPYVTRTPQWANGKGTIVGTPGECTACHDDVTGFAGTAHVKHVAAGTGKGYTCTTCHSQTVNSTPEITSKSKHVNGVKDVSFSGSIGAQPLSGTCSTVYCHTNGKGGAPEVTPTFASLASGQCGACHKAAPALASGRPLISSNAHFAHMSSTYGPKSFVSPAAANTSCARCHTYTTELAASHVNGTVEVLSGGGSACVACHPNGLPAWTGGRVTCESCHTGTPSVINGLSAPIKANFTAKGHGQAGAGYNSSRQCSSCHDPNSPHISNALGTYKRIATNNNSLCDGCHYNPAKVPTASKRNVTTHAIDQGVYTMDCKVCHDVHGTGNVKMVKTTIVFGALTSTITYGSSSDLVRLTPPYRGVCQTCHTKTSHYRRNVNEGTNHPTTGCLNCHTHRNTFAFKPMACDECHGYPPAPKGFVPTQANFSSAKLENYSGGGGAHVKAGHLAANVRPIQGFAPCVSCHADSGVGHVGHAAIFNPLTSATTAQKKANTSVRVDGAYKFNASKPLDAGQYRKVTPGNSGSCWNVSCHFQPTPRWSSDK